MRGASGLPVEGASACAHHCGTPDLPKPRLRTHPALATHPTSVATRPSPLDALQSALEARIDADVTTTLGPLAALRDALVAYETAIRDQLARDAFAAIPEIATAIPAPDVPAAGLAVLTALRAAARAYQAPPAALARTALETALVVVGGGREGGRLLLGRRSATRALRLSRYAFPPRPVYAPRMPDTPARTKYHSYKLAFDEMRRASEQGCPLHTVALAESILSDRILSFLLSRGETFRGGTETPFGTLLKKLEPHLTGREKFTLAELEAFRRDRNAAVHGLTKSLPGAAPMTVDEFRVVAQRAADNGRTLAREVADWVKAQKRPRSPARGSASS